ncbi:molybdopterin molybdotransferase [Streptacidiphilus sp. MAP12-20]|uniref:molybdopterin molybdotransferase MoeA n=1 Tax=Streptacidiphilus sp. MAP12-20 TaxID=3156299 RepID=UPI00351315E8
MSGLADTGSSTATGRGAGAETDLLAAYPYLRPQAAGPAVEPEPERPFDYEAAEAAQAGRERARESDSESDRESGRESDRDGSFDSVDSFDRALDDAISLTHPSRPRSQSVSREAFGDLERDPVAQSPAPAPRAHAVSWLQARALAARAGARPLGAESCALTEALGAVLAEALAAATHLPPFDTSAMDGWAVAGPGPWRLRAPADGEGLAGRPAAPALEDGEAVRIATGASVPGGATAVLRHEDGEVRERGGANELSCRKGAQSPLPGRDIRPRGQECRAGEPLLAAGTLVTPAVLGLAAAVGLDELTVHRRPTVELLVLGDELLTEGPPRDGRIRDALGPMLPAWLAAYGARVQAVRRIGDDRAALVAALRRTRADVVVSTGATAAGPVDFLHAALAEIGATLLVDGVRVRPGHPMLLAALPREGGAGPTRHLVGLPGNPLAAAVGAATLAEPLLRGLAGSPQAESYRVPAAADLSGYPGHTRLLPVTLPERGALPLRFDGPAMLRGLALAEGLAVVPPGGVDAGGLVEVLDVPCG